MKRSFLFAICFLTSLSLFAQKSDSKTNGSSADSLFDTLNKEKKQENTVLFESPKLILTESTETIRKKNLTFFVLHRFGDLGGEYGGGKYFYGLDAIADVYIGFLYGLTDNLNIELGRTTIPSPGGMLDLKLKYALLHQTNDNSVPIAISLIGQTALRPYNSYPSFGDRLSYFGEVVFGRSFSRDFSFEIAPSIVQNNQPMPNLPGSPEQFFSISAAARLKITKFMGVIVDYAHPFSSYRNNAGFSDPLGFGIQTVTGGHVFTLNITNARAISEINYLSNTTSDYFRGQLRLGFTISRTFDFSHKEHYNPK